MEKHDFDLILIESFKHETKQSYFKAKMKQYECNPNEYLAGLLKSFKEINLRTHQTDLTRGIITKQNGDKVSVTIRSNPVEVGYASDDDNDDDKTEWQKEVAYYGKSGKVSFPYTENFDISEYTNGQFKGIINAAMTEELWPHLQKFCQSIIDKKSKKEQELKGKELFTGIEISLLEDMRKQTEDLRLIIESVSQSVVNKSIKGIQSEYNVDQIGKIFDKPNEKTQRIDTNKRTDFISVFQANELKIWKPLKWEGSNPELATLIFKLTGISPIPSIVNKYFITASKYDSNSHGGSRNDNLAIKRIINSCIK